MKKVIFLFLAIFSIVNFANSQITKGTWLLSGIMKKTILLFLSLFFTSFIYGQVSETAEINFRVENHTYYKQFLVKIKRTKDDICIEYKIRMNENGQLRENDTATKRIRNELANIKNINPENDSLLSALNALDSIYIAFTSFRVDSIHLSINSIPEYNKLIDQILITPTDSLQKENKDKIYLDATSFTFKIKTENKFRTVYARAINKNNYPQLAEFVAATMALYRDNKKNNFLDRKATMGY